jgi:predicted kinase
MKTPLLLIITGPPCSGKTTLGMRLAHDLNLPYLYKDGIKELLFDTLGWKDRSWSKQLGHASSEILYYFTGALLAAGCSVTIESNFYPEFTTPKLLAIQADHPFTPFTVQCSASRDILFQRFKQRAESSQRHPGHLDHTLYLEFEETSFNDERYTLDIGGTCLKIDTSDFQRVDYNGLIEQIYPYINDILSI